MKIHHDLDITQLVTLCGFIISLILWGLKLEQEVDETRISLDAAAKMLELRWQENQRQLDSLQLDISKIEERLSQP